MSFKNNLLSLFLSCGSQEDVIDPQTDSSAATTTATTSESAFLVPYIMVFTMSPNPRKWSNHM